MTQTSYDAIVIGVGGMGSAAVYTLAKRGVDVLGLEQYDIPHTRGSSHGETRIFRLTQPEHPSYVPLAQHAHERWRELESESGTDLLTTTGSVHAGPEDGELVADALESVRTNEVDHELLTSAELGERFPAFELPEGHRAVYQPDGGFLSCERVITTNVNQAHEHGGVVRARERVRNWEPRESGVTVRTDRNTYEADNLVITTGAWAAKQLDVLQNHLSPQRRVMIWLQPEEPANFSPDRFPVFSVDVPEGNFYGFPTAERPGFKFGRSPDVTEVVDPNDWQNEPTMQDEHLLRQLPDGHFAGDAGSDRTMGMATCLVTTSTDGHFYLDTHPEYPHVSFAAGFTGHGFKFVSAIGDVLADFVTEGDTDLPIGVHRLDGRR
ncbi:N-methyltryptophan oxidase [Natrialba hulunbeirensis JCM 10989]|uniref:N-methyltryptophan oxidase n=1 Tax=Natrialba hulunbeirensis JCM 10989 TaxID=1227493 RepID=L9ZVJ9_9EURY|nr:N-methyl-L-tryptophan oxidase [Natrialba hulunbeirensis]ELY89193.1 N-methyltryptophan oxidase [Natrialba hulunbeirensis JCM 10989]